MSNAHNAARHDDPTRAAELRARIVCVKNTVEWVRTHPTFDLPDKTQRIAGLRGYIAKLEHDLACAESSFANL